MLSPLAKILSKPNIAVDLGTANTRIHDAEAGRIAEEPSVVRLLRGDGAVTDDAYIANVNAGMIANPLRGGVIVDSHNAVSLLKPLLKKARRFFVPPNSLACAPTDTTERERRRLSEALLHAGAASVAIIPELFAAAVGGGIDVASPSARMVIDVGDGVTDMAVFRDGSIVSAHAVRTACSDLKQAIRSSVLSAHRVKLSCAESERLTNLLANFVGTYGLGSGRAQSTNCKRDCRVPLSASPYGRLPARKRPASYTQVSEQGAVPLTGINVADGVLCDRLATLFPGQGHEYVLSHGVDIGTRDKVSVELHARHIVLAMQPAIDRMLAAILAFLSRLPERIHCEVIEAGILLTGGGACIAGLDRVIAQRTNIDVLVADDPLHCVINGATMILAYLKEEKSWCETVVWPLPSA